MPMPEIAKETTDPKTGAKRTTYKPFVGKVTAHSSYNVPGKKPRFAIEGADNFWSLGPGVTDLDKDFPNPPPVGYLAVWTLQMSDVTGQFAGPGKHYRDVTKVEQVPDGYVAPAVKPVDVNDLPWDKDEVTEVLKGAADALGKASAVSAYDDRETRTRISIEQQTAFRGYGEVVAALATVKVVPMWPQADETDAVQRIIEDFMRLGAILSHLPPAPAKPEETPDAKS